MFSLFLKSKNRRKDVTTGEAGEKAACDFLRQQSYKIVEQNWKSKIGELDIVAKLGETLVFVEVKSSKKLGSIPPEMRVNTQKQKKLKQLARLYLLVNQIAPPVRFDVIAVWWEEEIKIKHIENAFS